jgi:DHA1 family L-arabinose/isopropyl-beta-D-thiogalactopyranoside export protein-like MFS transporter/DHA1 family inner membrane transport protein
LFLYRHSPLVAFSLTAAVSSVTALALLRPLLEPPLPDQASLSEFASDAHRLVYPSLAFFAAAFALGGIYTFLPLVGGNATAALLAFGLAFAAGRKAGGTSRVSAAVLTWIFVAGGVVGTLALASEWGRPFFLGAALLAGLGIGGICTLTLVVLVSRSERELYSAIATTWNVVYDAGIAFGGLLLGLVAAGMGLRTTFVVGGAVFLAIALPATVLDRRLRRTSSAAVT